MSNYDFLLGENPPDPVTVNLSSRSDHTTAKSNSVNFEAFAAFDANDFDFEAPQETDFSDVLEDIIATKGIKESAEIILSNKDLKTEITKLLFKDSHDTLKSSLKKSQLCADKNDREYLLSLNPKALCEEFKMNSNPAFLLLVQGILGISNPDDIFESQYLLNNIVFIYSTVSKIINRKASGYALLMTSAVRDGGLREDSIKLFSMLVHPRTSQRHDKEVLAQGWDQPLQAALASERTHFERLHSFLLKKTDLCNDASTSDEAIAEVDEEIASLMDSTPLQVQKVWDNLNLRTKHRRERGDDDYAKHNFDWMASLFIKDRINTNHMSASGPVKDAADITIEDFVPTDTEKNYILESLVYYFASRLTDRYPLAFKSINSSIKPNKPHQFQAEMNSKSEEFTGDLYTKSESKTEDLISMMAEIQDKYVHTFKDSDGNSKCYERKILSGDNKGRFQYDF